MRRTGPLAGLPSKPGAHIAKIKAMKDGEWLCLGAPKPDPAHGLALGRSYTPKMAYAPDLGGAFLYGEGRHLATYKHGGKTYYTDDFWFYDVNQHRWICIFPGNDVNDYKRKLSKEGWEVTPDGEYIPANQLLHGYEQTAYIQHLGKFMFLPTSVGWGPKSVLGKQRDKWLSRPGKGLGDRSDPKNPKSDPRLYDVATGKWERIAAAGDPPWGKSNLLECNALYYVARTKQALFYMRRSVFWAYDLGRKHWSKVEPKGPGPRTQYYGRGISCFDPRTERVYAQNVDAEHDKKWIFRPPIFRVYEIGTNTWVDPKPKNPPTLHAGSASGVMTFDRTSNAVVLSHYYAAVQGKDHSLFVYDVEANNWTHGTIGIPARKIRYTVWNGFYHPVLNVHVYHLASDSYRNGVIWVYRYKRRQAKLGEVKGEE